MLRWTLVFAALIVGTLAAIATGLLDLTDLATGAATVGVTAVYIVVGLVAVSMLAGITVAKKT